MKSIKKNFILTSIYQIFYIITPLITTPYTSRVLGANGIGDYAFGYSVANYFVLFIRLGVLTYGNRTIATARDDKKILSKTFCEIYTLQLICGGIFTTLYVLWTLLLAPKIDLSIILLLFVLSAAIDITWLLYGVEDFAVTTVRDICIRILTVVCIFTLVRTEKDLWIYTLIQSTGCLIGQLLAWIRIKKHIYYIKPSRAEIIKHLKPNFILFIPSIAVSVYKTMDKIMLGMMTNSVELGYYESSERVINLPMALITALGTVMLPRMSNLIANNEPHERIQKIVDKSLIIAVFISTLLCFGMMGVANQFVPLFYGEGYDKCVELYYWLLPSCVFLAYANVIRTQYLLPRNRDKQFIISLFVGAGINILLNIILIPFFESTGAAIATLVAEASVCIVQIYYTYKELNLRNSVNRLVPFVLAGICMFVILYDQKIVIGGKILSLLVKSAECGLSYLFVFVFICFFQGLKSSLKW